MVAPDRQLADWFKVLSAPTRLRMIDLLKGRSLCVDALAARLNVTPGAVSQHLRLMRQFGLVTGEKRGHYVHYRLNVATLAAWRRRLDALLNPKVGVRRNKKGARPCAAASKASEAAKNRKN